MKISPLTYSYPKYVIPSAVVYKNFESISYFKLFNTLGHHLIHDASFVCHLGDNEFIQAFHTNS
jgi:hypothetical protein